MINILLTTSRGGQETHERMTEGGTEQKKSRWCNFSLGNSVNVCSFIWSENDEKRIVLDKFSQKSTFIVRFVFVLSSTAAYIIQIVLFWLSKKSSKRGKAWNWDVKRIWRQNQWQKCPKVHLNVKLFAVKLFLFSFVFGKSYFTPKPTV